MVERESNFLHLKVVKLFTSSFYNMFSYIYQGVLYLLSGFYNFFLGKFGRSSTDSLEDLLLETQRDYSRSSQISNNAEIRSNSCEKFEDKNAQMDAYNYHNSAKTSGENSTRMQSL